MCPEAVCSRPAGASCRSSAPSEPAFSPATTRRGRRRSAATAPPSSGTGRTPCWRAPLGTATAALGGGGDGGNGSGTTVDDASPRTSWSTSPSRWTTARRRTADAASGGPRSAHRRDASARLTASRCAAGEATTSIIARRPFDVAASLSGVVALPATSADAPKTTSFASLDRESDNNDGDTCA